MKQRIQIRFINALFQSIAKFIEFFFIIIFIYKTNYVRFLEFKMRMSMFDCLWRDKESVDNNDFAYLDC